MARQISTAAARVAGAGRHERGSDCAVERCSAPAPELDRLIHERIRLGMVSALAVNESLSFNDLKKLLKTTDGNLSVHARRLKRRSTSSAKSTLRAGCRKPFTGSPRPAGGRSSATWITWKR